MKRIHAKKFVEYCRNHIERAINDVSSAHNYKIDFDKYIADIINQNIDKNEFKVNTTFNEDTQKLDVEISMIPPKTILIPTTWSINDGEATIEYFEVTGHCKIYLDNDCSDDVRNIIDGFVKELTNEKMSN
jgi:hypothetical protein